jgi:hypothetical protein
VVAIELPRRLLNAWNVTLECFLAETDTAKVEITHESTWATTLKATTNDARSELRRTVCFDDH